MHACTGEGKGNPLQCSCLENPRDGGARWAAVYGVAQSRPRLKRLSSSSSSIRANNQSRVKILCPHIHLEKTQIQKDKCIPMFTAALFITAKTRKQLRDPSTDERVKLWHIYIYTHTHNGAVLSYQKEWNEPFATTRMDLEVIRLSETSQTEKEKYHMTSLTCGIWKVVQMNFFTKQKQTPT